MGNIICRPCGGRNVRDAELDTRTTVSATRGDGNRLPTQPSAESQRNNPAVRRSNQDRGKVLRGIQKNRSNGLASTLRTTGNDRGQRLTTQSDRKKVRFESDDTKQAEFIEPTPRGTRAQDNVAGASALVTFEKKTEPEAPSDNAGASSSRRKPPVEIVEAQTLPEGVQMLQDILGHRIDETADKVVAALAERNTYQRQAVEVLDRVIASKEGQIESKREQGKILREIHEDNLEFFEKFDEEMRKIKQRGEEGARETAATTERMKQMGLL